jgi:endonuclease YncB( thermonuclease family)
MPLFLIIRLLSTVLLLSPAFAADFSGHVVSVMDGDTIEVLHTNCPERIRLNGIDCPEKGQAYGKEAKQATSALVFAKEVTLVVSEICGEFDSRRIRNASPIFGDRALG